ncbi:DUF4166 domain-containing protein [Sporosarcina sp. JAI121]|uniref:DUF4166 domain-containing protein n=1 Tax=Sporosarcina sp. JAI121 TaxID=2723064 RepID=UPI0015CABFC6|nr:DUF4166 domain-containing protein [Sporosarcina sp. JAI121]NYF25474.1 hypothetical protein [Sporosarcina sp. JAI121]
MSIFRQVLGNEFNRLHPMLQKRYDLSAGATFRASGVMKEIGGGSKWLYPILKAGVRWKLLYPERGVNIPFTIINTAFVGDKGESQVHWERIFQFGKTVRYFNALMSYDAKRLVIRDYLGEPHLLYADLDFQVATDGRLTITSLGQRLVLGKFEIPLPRIFQGLATVTERFDDERGLYHIHVEVRNPLIGIVFCYDGEFSADVDV